MASQFLIYGLLDPRSDQGSISAIRYVGLSSTGLNRPKCHGREAYLRPQEHTHKARWIRELQRAGLTYSVVVLEEVDSAEDLNAREMFWVAKCKAEGAELTNATAGGDGIWGHKHSEQTKRRMRQSARRGEKHHRFGKPFTDEEKLRVSKKLGGQPIVDGNGVVYVSLHEAARRTGFLRHHIKDAIARGGTVGGGYGAKNRGKGLTFRYLTSDDAAEGAVPASSTNAAPTVTKD